MVESGFGEYKPEFHGTEASYILPSDPKEQQRLKEQHDAWKELMHDDIVHAPVKDARKIVDIGCGPGATTLDLATKFPNAQVYGIDLLALPKEHANPPVNVEYIQGDVMKLASPGGDARFTPGSLDYIFHRLLVCGVTDWPNYVKTAASLVKSGGWIEMHELDYAVWEDGVEVTHEWPWQQEQIQMAKDVKGLDLRCAQKLERWMKGAGLVDVHKVSYLAPFGQWNVETHPESKNIADYLHRWWRELNWVVLMPALQGTGTPEHVEGMRGSMLRTLSLAEKEQKKAYEIVVCYGRKP